MTPARVEAALAYAQANPNCTAWVEEFTDPTSRMLLPFKFETYLKDVPKTICSNTMMKIVTLRLELIDAGRGALGPVEWAVIAERVRAESFEMIERAERSSGA